MTTPSVAAALRERLSQLGYQVRRCKQCPAFIVDAVDVDGKRQVLDVGAPTYVLVRPEQQPHACVRIGERAEVFAFVSHWKTCPGAAKIRAERCPT